MKTRISTEPVPIKDKIEAMFGVGSVNGMIFAYDHTIYTDGGTTVPADLVFHEEVHFKQQDEYEGGVDAWWDMYLNDPEFRFNAELEAYGQQIARYTTHASAKRGAMLDWAAKAMSSPAYGGMVDFHSARRLLKAYIMELEA